MPLKTTPEEPPNLNMIPMIDIMFNLIIFFLVSTSVESLERDIALRVPTVADKGVLSSAPSPRVVNVYRDGKINLDSKPASLEELTDRLATARVQYSDLKVVVRADGQGQFQRVAEVLNACKQAGVRELGISVRLLSGNEKASP